MSSSSSYCLICLWHPWLLLTSQFVLFVNFWISLFISYSCFFYTVFSLLAFFISRNHVLSLSIGVWFLYVFEYMPSYQLLRFFVIFIGSPALSFPLLHLLLPALTAWCSFISLSSSLIANVLVFLLLSFSLSSSINTLYFCLHLVKFKCPLLFQNVRFVLLYDRFDAMFSHLVLSMCMAFQGELRTWCSLFSISC